MVFLGIDIGTSGCKAVLVEPTGDIMAYAYHPYETLRPQSGWVEQEPLEWWQATRSVVRQCLDQSALSPAKIKACGVTGHFPTLVLVDEHGRPTGNAILYSDGRATVEAGELSERFEPQTFGTWTGLPSHYRSNLPVTKLRWLKRHDPNRVRQARWALEPKDFINLRLTGQAAVDYIEAGWSGLVRRGQDVPERYLCEFAGCKPDLLPKIAHPADALGFVTAEAAREVGLNPGTPVAVGTGDGICNILGAGVVEPGRVVDVAGSTGLIGVAVEIGSPLDEDLFAVRTGGIVDGVDLAYSSMANAGNCLEWLANAWTDGGHGSADFSALDTECARGSEGPGDLIFLPYLDGAFSPVVDPKARGAFLGLSADHRRPHLYRAVLEGVAYGLAEVVEHLDGTTPAPDTVRAAGGGAASDLWLQIKADVLGLPFEKLKSAQTGCIGAAVLGAVAVEAYPSVTEAAESLVQVDGVVQPNLQKHGVYQKRRAVFNEAFGRVAGLSKIFTDV